MNTVQIPRRFVRHEWGGTETVILETSKRLPDFGYTARILCPNALADNNAEEIEGVPVQRFPYFYPYLGLRKEARMRLDKKGGNLFSFHLMHALATFPELDLIHLHTTMRVGGIGRYIARQRRIPYIVTLHGGVIDVPTAELATMVDPSQGSLEWGRVLGKWVGSHQVMDDADAILCVGENERQAVQSRFPNKRVIYLPNGVDSSRFAQGDRVGFRSRHGIPEDAFLLLTVARIDPQKNQLFAVRSLPEIIRCAPETHLLLVGAITNQNYHEQILAEASRLGVRDRITIIPGIVGQELINAYHSADVFLLTSRHEPFGIVILEAWASHLPVVAAAVGGISHFVQDKKDTLLYPSEDQRAMITCILQLRESQQQKSALIAQGYCRAVHEFDWKQITERLAGIYAEIVTDHRTLKKSNRQQAV